MNEIVVMAAYFIVGVFVLRAFINASQQSSFFGKLLAFVGFLFLLDVLFGRQNSSSSQDYYGGGCDCDDECNYLDNDCEDDFNDNNDFWDGD